MAVSPVLVIKIVDDSSVGVRARWRDEFVEHHIVLNSVLAEIVIGLSSPTSEELTGHLGYNSIMSRRNLMRWCLAQIGLSALTWSGSRSFPGGDGLSLGLEGPASLKHEELGRE